MKTTMSSIQKNTDQTRDCMIPGFINEVKLYPLTSSHPFGKSKRKKQKKKHDPFHQIMLFLFPPSKILRDFCTRKILFNSFYNCTTLTHMKLSSLQFSYADCHLPIGQLGSHLLLSEFVDSAVRLSIALPQKILRLTV